MGILSPLALKQALALANVFAQKLRSASTSASTSTHTRSAGPAAGPWLARARSALLSPTKEGVVALDAEMSRALHAQWIVPDFRAKLAQAYVDEFSFQFSQFSEYFRMDYRLEAARDGGAANSRSVHLHWPAAGPALRASVDEDEETESDEEDDNEDEDEDDNEDEDEDEDDEDDEDDDDEDEEETGSDDEVEDDEQRPCRSRKRRRTTTREAPGRPQALRAHLDETMFVIPADHAGPLTEQLFAAMPRVLERFDAKYEKHERFRKQLMVWNKMRLDGVWQYEYSNMRGRALAKPMLPRSLFPLPPTEIYAPLCELLFGPAHEVRPAPLLHWSLFEVNEGKLIGLNFDSPPQIARLPYHPYTHDFQKLEDAHYAVILMLSSHDRVIKYYREPTSHAKNGKKVTDTKSFRLRNGEVVIVPQRKRVCVTASQITKFDAGRQKYYFFVFYYGPRFRLPAEAA